MRRDVANGNNDKGGWCGSAPTTLRGRSGCVLMSPLAQRGERGRAYFIIGNSKVVTTEITRCFMSVSFWIFDKL